MLTPKWCRSSLSAGTSQTTAGGTCFTSGMASPWHDGEPFIAADVAFTYTMLLDPRAGSRYQSLALPVRGAEEYARGEAASVAGLDAIDDRTIRVRAGPAPLRVPGHDGIPDCASTRPRRYRRGR